MKYVRIVELLLRLYTRIVILKKCSEIIVEEPVSIDSYFLYKTKI